MRMFIAVVVSTIVLSISACLADARAKVWVQPFSEANNLQSPDWITHTLHQSLVDELASSKDVQLMQSDSRPAGAQYVVVAQIQRAGADLRITGQVIDSATNKAIGGFKATGDARGLFVIEDSLATQINTILPKDGKSPAAVAAATTQPIHIEMPFAPGHYGPFDGSDLQQSLRTNAPLTAPPPPPTPVYDNPPVYSTPTYTDNVGINGNYPYGYGSPYGYDYGSYGWGWGGGVIIINQGDNHHGNGGNGNHGGMGPSQLPSGNGQAIRAASGFGGQAPPPGVINTISGRSGGR